ncbi:MAG: hypothetical protein ACM33T_02385 [Solirubrobacterales bacterium]
MPRNKQPTRKETPPPAHFVVVDDGTDIRVPVLVELLDDLDLNDFLLDPACRRRLNEVIETFSDDEFDNFERLYTSRFTIN